MIEIINEQMIGFNVVKQFNVKIDAFTFKYDLILVLAETEEIFANEIQINFEDISQLNLTNFGGGLMQFMHLYITKLNDGLERQKYEVSELENNKIGFRCFKFHIENK